MANQATQSPKATDTPSVLCLMDQGGGIMQVEQDITGTLRKESRGHDPVIAIQTGHTTANGSNISVDVAQTLNRDAAPAIAFHPTQDPIHSEDGTTHAMGCGSSGGQASIAVAFTQNQAGDVLTGEVMHNLGTNSNATGRNAANVQTKMQVRRLTPAECEKLQGFPVGHTAIIYKGKPAADGARYKALGNSMAVNCMSWLGQRIQMCDEVLSATPPTPTLNPKH